jgi:Bardet-Biedl syndrome 7 protein
MVIPKVDTGNKTCQCLDIPLKPLNLHERVEQVDDKVWELLPLSRIKMLGKFSLSDAHNWISNCLPDVPHNIATDETD